MPNIRKGAEAKEIYLCGCHEKLFELASKYVTAKCRVELLACFPVRLDTRNKSCRLTCAAQHALARTEQGHCRFQSNFTASVDLLPSLSWLLIALLGENRRRSSR